MPTTEGKIIISPLQQENQTNSSQDQSREDSLLCCDKTLLLLRPSSRLATKDTSATPLWRPASKSKSAFFAPPVICDGQEWPLYLFEYNYGNKTWCFTIRASSPEDAQARVNRLYYASYLGEIGGEIPANPATSILVRLGCFIKNIARRTAEFWVKHHDR